ncbi:MAG: tyrosine-type recombinase/integrase [Alphaproteobacteria bacterium]
MRPRSQFPGMARRRRGDTVALYWLAPRAAVLAGYPLSTVRLHDYVDGSDTLAERCQALQAELDAWLVAERRGAVSEPAIRFDGTLASLVWLYETHPDSPYHDKAPGTRRVYADDLRLIVRVVGARRLARLTGLDFLRWYREFRKPKASGMPERTRRAHGVMTMLRILFSYGSLLGLPECRRLRDVLSELRFADAAPREQQITIGQVRDFIAKAHDLGYPEMALAQALQFETTLRQWDVIGEWSREAGTKKRGEGWRWSKGLTWTDIDRDRVLRKRTSKTEAPVTIDLNDYPLVTAELNRAIAAWGETPRIGPVIIDARTGEPFKRRAFAERWREIARAAGIPDDVWNRDSRAGGITEGADAGADIEDLRQHAGHADARTTQRYNRRSLAKAKRVAQLRVASRKEV